jgi:hypothetical protein
VEEEPKKWKTKEKEQPIAPVASGGSGRIVKLKKWKAKEKEQSIAIIANGGSGRIAKEVKAK